MENNMTAAFDVDKNVSFHSIYEHPTMADYYTKLTPFITLCIFISTLLFLLNVSIFFTTVSILCKNLQKSYLVLSILMCVLYPVICLAALMTILIPKAWLICHTVMHLSFTFGAVVFHRLCLRYVDSEVNYIKETDGTAVAINTPPCCCCCLCLPAIIPSKTKFSILKYMVWQMPFVQGSVMLVLNAVYYREEEIYAEVLLYFMPFIVMSIVLGLWSLNITVGMVHKIHTEMRLMKKMICLQLVLLLCKLQYMVLDNQLVHIDMGGPYPINHTVYKQTIINLLILIEMVLVSLFVQHSYKIPVQNVKK